MPLKRTLEPLLKAAAMERQVEGGRLGGQGGGKLPQASEGKTRDKIAEVVGIYAERKAKGTKGQLVGPGFIGGSDHEPPITRQGCRSF
jgi:hypothetical protein